MTPVGLPHSEISGSKRACRSPKLIAACYVLHRLSVPRHPPSTLSNLTIKCLDLMRSADRHLSMSCAFLYLQPVFNCQRTMNREDRRCPQTCSFACTADTRGHFLRRGVPGIPIWNAARRVGGADRDRTDDPLLAKQVLSQLSYSPV